MDAGARRPIARRQALRATMEAFDKVSAARPRPAHVRERSDKWRSKNLTRDWAIPRPPKYAQTRRNKNLTPAQLSLSVAEARSTAATVGSWSATIFTVRGRFADASIRKNADGLEEGKGHSISGCRIIRLSTALGRRRDRLGV